jgi:hypothetical protein
MMIYTVTFTQPDGDEGYSVFTTVEHARDFIASRPPDYAKDFVITEHSEDGKHVAVVE